jgi:hypothetical protein
VILNDQKIDDQGPRSNQFDRSEGIVAVFIGSVRFVRAFTYVGLAGLYLLTTIGCNRQEEIDRSRQEAEKARIELERAQSQLEAARTARLAKEEADREEEQRRQAASEAISKVGAKLSQIMQQLGLKEGATPEEARRALSSLHLELATVDTSDCPQDFRQQYDRVVGSARELAEKVEGVPLTDGEKFIELLKQLNSDSPDFNNAALVNEARLAFENFTREARELSVVAKKYGVSNF